MNAYNSKHTFEDFQLPLMYCDIIITQNMQTSSVNSYFFINKKEILLLVLLLAFVCKMCGVNWPERYY